MKNSVRDAANEDLGIHEVFCFEGRDITPTKMQSTRKYYEFKSLKDYWSNPGHKDLKTRMILKLGNDLSPKRLPAHSVVAANDFTTQSASVDHDMSSLSAISNHIPSTLESSNEANQRILPLTPKHQQKHTIEPPRRAQLTFINLL